MDNDERNPTTPYWNGADLQSPWLMMFDLIDRWKCELDRMLLAFACVLCLLLCAFACSCCLLGVGCWMGCVGAASGRWPLRRCAY